MSLSLQYFVGSSTTATTIAHGDSSPIKASETVALSTQDYENDAYPFLSSYDIVKNPDLHTLILQVALTAFLILIQHIRTNSVPHISPIALHKHSQRYTIMELNIG